VKRLLLMRHAKSDWEADYGSDHERPLNGRGVRSALLMGRALTAKGLIPGLVVSSSAVRARRTAELAAEAGRWPAAIRLDRSLYESGPDGVLLAASAAPDIGTLMLVGHQPTWSILARNLTGEPVEMRTATVVVIEMSLDTWADVPGASGTLVEVLSPGDFVSADL
jgi:phosphohistidine phosphatase